jgi:pimeloyl-ACP methyl ester carboxylesterase
MRRFLFGLLCLPLWGCFPFSQKIKDDTAAFEKSNPRGLRSISAEGRTLHYAVAGPERAPLVLFVHGSPGSWDAFAAYLMDPGLTSTARLVSVDRPGYGGSDRGRVEPSLQAQAAQIAQVILAEGDGKPAVVLGHSLGGPVAARMAMDFPQLVKGLVLVAPSIDPAMEETKWIQVPGNWFWVRWMLPSALDVCNQEILPLKGELEKMLPLWAGIKMPVIDIQGLDDDLVPPENADFAERELVNAKLKVERIPGMNHFVPWSRPDLLKNAILELLNEPINVNNKKSVRH